MKTSLQGNKEWAIDTLCWKLRVARGTMKIPSTACSPVSSWLPANLGEILVLHFIPFLERDCEKFLYAFDFATLPWIQKNKTIPISANLRMTPHLIYIGIPLGQNEHFEHQLTMCGIIYPFWPVQVSRHQIWKVVAWWRLFHWISSDADSLPLDIACPWYYCLSTNQVSSYLLVQLFTWNPKVSLPSYQSGFLAG